MINNRQLGYQIGQAIKTQSALLTRQSITFADGDVAKARVVACEYLPALAATLEIREWQQGMTTQPGDLVYDPDKKYTYVYSGQTAMAHNNPLFYPGSAGVYYWAIVPEIYNGHKVYPDISGIIVSVRNNEMWWNSNRTGLFKWKGADNNACVWPPASGNEEAGNKDLWQKIKL